MSPLPSHGHSSIAPTSLAALPATGAAGDRLAPALALICREAGLTRLQSACIVLSLARSLPPRRIALHVRRRVSDVQEALAQSRARLSGRPGFWGDANRFTRDLVFCASDLRRYDDRPPGVRGVTPDTLTRGWRCGRLIAADDKRLRQDLDAALRLWARGLLENPAP